MARGAVCKPCRGWVGHGKPGRGGTRRQGCVTVTQATADVGRRYESDICIRGYRLRVAASGSCATARCKTYLLHSANPNY